MRALAVLFCFTLASAEEPAEIQDAGPAPSPAESPVVAQPAPPRGREERDRWLAMRIDALIAARPELAPTRIGIAVDDVATARPIFRRNGDQPFNIASNTKVVTTAAVLALLGPEYKFRTQVFADAIDASGTITGNLYLRGAGDPSLDTPALWSLANELALIGVKKVSGALVIDESFFDAETTPPAFDQKKEDAAFRAPVGAASLDYNAVTVWVQPAPASGQPARIALAPAQDQVTVKSTVTTVDKGRTSIEASAVPTKTGTEVTLSGQIRHDDLGGEAVRKRIDRPGAFTGGAFRFLLARAGVKIAKETRFGPVPKAARAIVSHTSAPVGVLVRDMMKYSNNFMAETLMKTAGAEVSGAPGTWPKGIAAVSGWLEDAAGLARGTYRYENGSGLYDSNRFTPAQVVKVLATGARDVRTGAEYIAALAIAGADGTLIHRMQGTAAERYVRGKTGTLDNVSCLSGFAGAGGRPLAFAVLVNDLPETATAIRAAHSLQDEVAALLILYLEAGD